MPCLCRTATKKPYACICNQCLRLYSSIGNTIAGCKIITYPRASTVAQSLTIDRNFARISSSQESARINAFHHVFAFHPLSHDWGFKRSAIANIYNNRLTPNKHAVKHQPAKKCVRLRDRSGRIPVYRHIRLCQPSTSSHLSGMSARFSLTKSRSNRASSSQPINCSNESK